MYVKRTGTHSPAMIGHPMDTKNRRWGRVEPRTGRSSRRPWYTTDAAA